MMNCRPISTCASSRCRTGSRTSTRSASVSVSDRAAPHLFAKAYVVGERSLTSRGWSRPLAVRRHRDFQSFAKADRTPLDGGGQPRHWSHHRLDIAAAGVCVTGIEGSSSGRWCAAVGVLAKSDAANSIRPPRLISRRDLRRPRGSPPRCPDCFERIPQRRARRHCADPH